MVDLGNRSAAFRQGLDAVQTHGIEALEDVSILAMLRGTAVLLDKALNVLEPGDDALLPWGATAGLLRLDINPKLGQKRVIFLSKISH